MAKKVILDVDTGIDDMVAIIMAAKSDLLHIEGVVATGGNQPVDITIKNTLSVCQLLQMEAPVYKGSSLPLVKEAHFAPHIHGKDGLGGVTFPPLVKEAEALPGVLFIIETIRNNPHEITLIATGPLSDIALAFSIAPDIIDLLDTLVIMGGSIEGGNVTPQAEFNFFYDSEAAQIIFSSGASIVLVPLDVTSHVRISDQRLNHYEQVDEEVIRLMCQSLRYYQKAYAKNHLHDPIIHDAVCIAYVIAPQMFDGSFMNVFVKNSYDERYGKMEVENSDTSLTYVTTDIDTSLFFELFESLII